jgi:hypothetical protein
MDLMNEETYFSPRVGFGVNSSSMVGNMTEGKEIVIGGSGQKWMTHNSYGMEIACFSNRH